MLPRACAPVLAAALLLSGCGAASKSSAGSFSGEDRRVAQVVEDLQKAGESSDAAEICSRILSKRLVDRLAARGASCTQELDDALGDADSFELDVKGVQVSGTRATAVVENGKAGPRSLELVREDGGWRVNALSTG